MLTTSRVNQNSNFQNNAKNTSAFNRLISLLGQQAGNPLLASKTFSGSSGQKVESLAQKKQKQSATFNTTAQPTFTQKAR